MVCFIRLSRKMGVELPSSNVFIDWLERELMKEFKAKNHKELEKALTDKYNSDSWSLKLLIQELLVAYKMKYKKKKPIEGLTEELGVI